MAEQRKKRHFLKRSLIWLAGITFGLIVILGLLNVAAQTSDEIAGMVETLSSFGSIARFVRWGALGAIIMFWDQIIDYAAKSKGLDEEQVKRAKAMRWRVAGFILIFDLLVIESLPARLMD